MEKTKNIAVQRGPPENICQQTNAGLMLVHRLRRWPNIKPTLGQRILFAGKQWK